MPTRRKTAKATLETDPAIRGSAVPQADNAGEDDDNAGSRIKSLSMTIRLLTAMADGGAPVGVSELARRVGESKARIHRHLQTLRDAGLLSQSDANGPYRLGWVLFELGQAAAAQFDVGDAAMTPMRTLRDATRLTVLLGQRDGDEMIVSHTLDSEGMIAVRVRKGLRLPAHGSAMGRVMLAYASAEDQKRILSQRLAARTTQTMTLVTHVRKRLADIRERRFEVSNGESEAGVAAIASPVLDDKNKMVAVVSLIGTQLQIGETPRPELLANLDRCAASISAELRARHRG